MYKKSLFSWGAKSFRPYDKRNPFMGRGCCGSGVKSNLDKSFTIIS
jgi:hypothetical protein